MCENNLAMTWEMTMSLNGQMNERYLLARVWRDRDKEF
ncbi:hypothetical protein CEV33_2109 [Brucella grignonensis]|uniref:Uncharacterized protein n=1 Tax=Brucella grignonensis TaxID=94627 RepID=A0A256F708_9HYPH|nr:hypothetical protein CEV33_2109 [Brucella grignonensis]